MYSRICMRTSTLHVAHDLHMRRLSFYCYVCTSFRLMLYFISYILTAKINVALQYYYYCYCYCYYYYYYY